MSAAVMERVGVQVPRVRSVPGYVSSIGLEAVELAESCGLELDPWQADTLTDSLGCRADGKFAAFEVGLNVARQNGKGGVLEARELASVVLLGDKLVIHSAHEFATSTVAMDRMEGLLEEGGLTSLLRRRGGVSRSHGSEGFVFQDGTRIWYRTRTKGGGRGFSADLVVLDEAMVLQAPFHGALLPIVSAKTKRENPQVWYTGSAVDRTVHEHGVVFARIRERGLAGDDPSLAYFEWSAEFTGEDGEPVPLERLTVAMLDDRDAWAQANPGLGIRIAEEHIPNERRSLGRREFAVERLGIGDWPDTSEDAEVVLDPARWDALVDSGSRIVEGCWLVFDVSPDRSSGSVGVAGFREDGRLHVEVLDRHPGTRWLPGRLASLVAELGPAGVACDAAGPAGSLLAQLDLEVETVSTTQLGQACGFFFDLVMDDAAGLRHLGQAELDAAVRGASRRPLGDRWAWSRQGSQADISPLVAVTIGAWLAARAPERPSGWRPL